MYAAAKAARRDMPWLFPALILKAALTACLAVLALLTIPLGLIGAVAAAMLAARAVGAAAIAFSVLLAPAALVLPVAFGVASAALVGLVDAVVVAGLVARALGRPPTLGETVPAAARWGAVRWALALARLDCSRSWYGYRTQSAAERWKPIDYSGWKPAAYGGYPLAWYSGPAKPLLYGFVMAEVLVGGGGPADACSRLAAVKPSASGLEQDKLALRMGGAALLFLFVVVWLGTFFGGLYLGMDWLAESSQPPWVKIAVTFGPAVAATLLLAALAQALVQWHELVFGVSAWLYARRGLVTDEALRPELERLFPPVVAAAGAKEQPVP